MKVTLPFHIGFTDGLKEFNLSLQDGARGISESGSQASTLLVTSGGQRTGDFEPNFSHIEQRTWHGGRASLNLVDDQTRFLDSQNLFSVFQDKVFPAPKWWHAKGLRDADEYESASKGWVSLIDDNRYVSVRSTNGFNNADKAYIWVRRKGEPRGDLRLSLYSDAASEPDAIIAGTTVDVTTDDITDVVSRFQIFNWTGTVNLTTYHVVVSSTDATDDIDNCWEVGVDEAGSGGLVSSDGLTWATASPGFKMNYRVVDIDIKRRWMEFAVNGAKYIVSVKDNNSNSEVYINGDRGDATSGGAATLTDTNKTWVVNRWAGAYVRIIGGPEKRRGQFRKILSNTATQLTVDEDWDVNPIAGSEYVIYHTPWWTRVTVSVATWGSVVDVAVLNDIAYFAFGSGVNIARMRVNASSHDFADDGTNKADKLYAFHDPIDGPQMWRSRLGNKISRSGEKTWGNNLAFSVEKSVGSTDWMVTNMIDYDNLLWVFKEDSLWTVHNDVPRKLNVGLKSIPGEHTGYAAAVHDLFLYFSWWRSMEQMYGGTLDDVGPWHDEGLPNGRDGLVSGIASMLSWVFVGIDADRNNSTAYIYANRGYHEIFRGYAFRHRIRNLFIQEGEGVLPRLWIDYNGELVYQDYSPNPLEEDNYDFMHEAVLASSVIDAGHADTYKFFKEIAISSTNLNRDQRRIEIDYKYGDEITGDSDWTTVPTRFSSTEEARPINVGEVKRIRYRIRLLTDDSTKPIQVKSIVVKGYEVLPVKRIWSMRIKASSIRSGPNAGADPGELYDWLWESTQRARRVWMYSVFPELNGVLVRLEPPSLLWRFINKASKWTGVFSLVVREM